MANKMSYVDAALILADETHRLLGEAYTRIACCELGECLGCEEDRKTMARLAKLSHKLMNMPAPVAEINAIAPISSFDLNDLNNNMVNYATLLLPDCDPHALPY